MKSPCEIVVSRILPLLRATLVKTLLDEYGLKQIEVANLLGITQSAVSQYSTSMRGSREELLEIFPEIRKYAELMAKEVTSGKPRKITLCVVCKEIRKNKQFERYYMETYNLDSCDLC